MGRLTADFAKAFSRDLKKNAKRRNWNLTELEKVIDLVVENTRKRWRNCTAATTCTPCPAIGVDGTNAMSPMPGTGWRSGHRTIRSRSSSVLAATTNYSGKPTLSESPASVLHIPYRQTDAYKPLTVSLSDWDYSSCSESSIHSISRDSDSSVTACNCSLSLPRPS